MSTTNYNCDQCGKPCTAKTVIYNRYKTHFCGKECKAAHQRGAKDRAKDERIRELEEVVKRRDDRIETLRNDRDRVAKEMDQWKANAQIAAGEALDALRKYGPIQQRNRKLRALAWAGWTSCLLCLLWALWGHFGRHLPTTYPDAGELVVCWQGESRTPHIAYVDSLGEWRDADNGEKLEVTKWSRP